MLQLSMSLEETTMRLAAAEQKLEHLDTLGVLEMTETKMEVCYLKGYLQGFEDGQIEGKKVLTIVTETPILT